MKLSIVVPLYLANEELVEMTCNLVLASIKRNFADTDIETVLVDDNSPLAGAAEILAKEIRDQGLNVSLVKNDQNLGYGMSVNCGVEAAQGTYILILNNDIYLPDDSCEKLIKYFNDFNLGMIGPALSDAHGYRAQQISSPGFIENYTEVPYTQIEEFSAKNTQIHSGEILDVNFLMGSCMLTTKDIWNRAGGISASYGKGYVEEVDLQVRIRKLGYKIAVARDVFVLHESTAERSPSYSLNKLNRKWLLSKNSILFLLRNGLKENWQLNYDWHHRTEWPLLGR